MRSVTPAFCLSALALIPATALAEPPRYTAIDITDWSEAQLASLPFFKHSAIAVPGTVPFGFTPVAASSAGHVAGSVQQGIPYAGDKTVLMRADGGGGYAPEYIESFGSYSWGYWSCDSKDCHYYFGYVRDCVPSDMNWAGVVVGRSTVAGSGEYSSQAVYHAFMYDADQNRIDLFPGDESSRASCINNRGEIAGYRSGLGAFRRMPDGAVSILDPIDGRTPSPEWINANGVVIGGHYPSRAFASPGGSVTFSLPDIGGFETVSAYDLNDSGWIVGSSGNFGEAETYATIWEPGSGGTWTEYDLVEQVDTPDVLLESAVAIDNSGNIMARGHEDGTDLFSSRTYWLVPEAPLPGWCTPDIGLHPSDVSTSDAVAAFSVAVVNEGDVRAYQWRRNGVDIDPASNPSASSPTLELSGLQGSDSGAVYDCVVMSDCGTTISEVALLSVESGCPADLNSDSVLDIFDVFVYLDLFNATDAAADFTGDGTLDIFDVFAFLDAFNAGCP